METPKTFSIDPAKERQNKALHKMSLREVDRFEFDSAHCELDTRENYGEEREVAYGFIGYNIHILVFTMRGETCRVISLRKANRTEARYYAENT
ncbi:MAG: BrnT family toxin [Rhizobiaceae bacterium]|nr:BrnT family toxin [Rhizobiaceae bacterium]